MTASIYPGSMEMGSRKRSARAKQIEDFKSQLGDMDEAFDREEERRKREAEEKEGALRWKSCESKKRYPNREEAEDAIEACARHGTTGLRCYRCDYCRGWHLTSHPGK